MNIQDILQTKISFYNRVNNKRSNRTITLFDWVTTYSLRNKNKIDRIREQYNIDPKTAKEMKADQLPCVTITGVFTQYRKTALADHLNPIFVIDIDRDDNPHIKDWDNLKKEVSKLPYIFLTSYSVSGRGIYALAYINIEKNITNIFNSLQHDFKEQLNITIDKSCKDITRLRFVSYDDNILINTGEIEMYDKELKLDDEIQFEDTELFATDSFTYKAIYHLITECGYRANKYEDWLQDCFRLSTFGDYGFILFILLSSLSDNYNEHEAKTKFKHCQSVTRYNKSCLVYYFAKLKQYYGSGWQNMI